MTIATLTRLPMTAPLATFAQAVIPARMGFPALYYYASLPIVYTPPPPQLLPAAGDQPPGTVMGSSMARPH